MHLRGWSAACLSLVALAACGGKGQENAQESKLALALPESTVTLEAGQTRLIALAVVGAGGQPVTFTGHWPAFAHLDGALLTLAPGRVDEGDYALVIDAAVSGNSARATLHVRVTAHDTAPTWSARMVLLGDANGIYSPGPQVIASESCPGPTCVLGASPSLYLVACDAESDAMTVEVEVVPRGQPFSASATHAVSGPAGTQSDRCGTSLGGCSCYKVALGGLLADHAYGVAARVQDALGATAAPFYSMNTLRDGWFTQSDWVFSTAP